MVLSLGGVYLAYHFYVKKPALAVEFKKSMTGVHQFWFSGWGFDALYDKILVRPFVFLATINKGDVIDKLYSSVVSISEFLHGIFARTQGGILRWYIMSMVLGAILILTLGLLL